MNKKTTPKSCGDIQMAKFLYDTACERLVVGTLIRYTWAYPLESGRLTEDLFCDPECCCIMKALIVVNEQRKDFTDVQLMIEIAKHNKDIQVPDLLKLSSNTLTTEQQFSMHVSHLVDLLMRRRIIQLSVTMGERCNEAGNELDEILGWMKSEFDGILSMGTPEGTTSLSDGLRELQTLINDRQEGHVRNLGTMVGFPQIDDDGGLMPGQLVIIAGATAHGKSALALSFVKTMLKQQIHVAYFSLEMTTLELSSRLLSMESGVATSRQLHPSRPLEQQEFIDVAQGLGRLEQESDYLHFNARFTANIDQICAAIRSMHNHYGIRGVFVDYLQILNSTQNVQNREQFMGEVTRRFKNLAVELGIWIVVLSQLNRNDLGEEPGLKCIRDSGQIAEAADRVLLIYRPEANEKGGYEAPFRDVDPHRTALLNLVKNRNGANARFIVDYIAERTLFTQHMGDLPRIVRQKSTIDKNPNNFNFIKEK